MDEINPLSKFLSPLISLICSKDTISVPGIVCGTIWGPFPVLGSFAVQLGDHLRYWDYLRAGIICGAEQLLPHFDVLCNLLLNRRTTTWKLFGLSNYEKTNRMWFSVVCTLVDNDMRHHSGQNVVQQIELYHKARALL